MVPEQNYTTNIWDGNLQYDLISTFWPSFAMVLLYAFYSSMILYILFFLLHFAQAFLLIWISISWASVKCHHSLLPTIFSNDAFLRSLTRWYPLLELLLFLAPPLFLAHTFWLYNSFIGKRIQSKIMHCICLWGLLISSSIWTSSSVFPWIPRPCDFRGLQSSYFVECSSIWDCLFPNDSIKTIHLWQKCHRNNVLFLLHSTGGT